MTYLMFSALTFNISNDISNHTVCYSTNLFLLQTRAPINYLVNEEELRNSNKQTFNTDNRELMANPQSLTTFYLQKENLYI